MHSLISILWKYSTPDIILSFLVHLRFKFCPDNILTCEYTQYATLCIVSRRNTINCLGKSSNHFANSREYCTWMENTKVPEFYFLRIALDSKIEEQVSDLNRLSCIYINVHTLLQIFQIFLNYCIKLFPLFYCNF